MCLYNRATSSYIEVEAYDSDGDHSWRAVLKPFMQSALYTLYIFCNLSLSFSNAQRASYDSVDVQEAQLMLTTGSTRLAVSRGQQTWYHSTCYI